MFNQESPPSVTLPSSGGTVSFKYDPLGRRIQKSFGGVYTNYLYDGDNLLEEMDGSGNVLARYVQGLGVDETLADVRGSEVSYYESDALGSTTSLTNSLGAVVGTYEYNSFGTAEAVEQALPFAIRAVNLIPRPASTSTAPDTTTLQLAAFSAKTQSNLTDEQAFIPMLETVR